MEVVVKEFPDLRQAGPVRLRVRAVRYIEPDPRLDIRIFVEPDQWTRRGIRLSAEEFEALLGVATEIRETLAGPRLQLSQRKSARRTSRRAGARRRAQ